jgi:YHS domain-containing protein
MMKYRRIVLAFVVVLAFSILAFSQAKNLRPRPEKARDPVCGLMVEKDPKLSAEYEGTTYYFCSNADRDKFKKNPHKYVKEPKPRVP